MAGRQQKRAAERAEKKADAKDNGKTHVMPVHYHWLTLGPPTALQIEVGERLGEPPDDWSGWQIEANRSIKLGMLSRAMRALGVAAEIETRVKAAQDDPDPEAMPEPADVGKLGEAYTGMITFLQAHVRAWDFGDENGDLIPYSAEAWEDLDQSLIVAAFAAVTNRVTTPPKAKAGTPTR